MPKSMQSSDTTLSAKARLRIRKRFLPLHTILPAVRWLSVTTLLICLTWGGIRFLTRPLSAGALEFTLHQFGSENGAKGVQGIATSDLDGDNDADIITAGTDGIKVYENEGKFGFNTHIVDTKKGERVQVVDLDGDDTRDLLVTLRGESNSVMWYRNNGDMDFGPHTLVTSGDQAVAYAADIDRDGRADIATTIRTSGDTRILSRWMNNGDGTFTETVLNSDSKVTTVTIGDTDGNNYPDIVTGGTGGLQRWRSSDGIAWVRDDIDDSKENGTHIVVADPGDGRTFIVTGDGETNSVAVYRSRENDMYGRMALGGDSTDVKTVYPTDFDNDGDLDILATGQDDNMVVWYDNEGDDMYTRRVLASNLQSVFGVATTDFDNDGDNDFVTSDHMRGPISVYERLRVKPEATKPGNVQQSTTGKGVVTFESTISDGDFDTTQLRVQYSLDGDHWYKPWLTKVTADNGTVDLKNSNGYQVGTNNPVDTDSNAAVKLTFTWDTKSIQNTGGALTGEATTVRVRVIPRDAKAIGTASVSSKFTVDNRGPTGLANLKISSITADEAILTWTAPKDDSSFSYEIFFGTNSKAVLEQTSDSWDSDDDDSLSDIETTSTTITDLEENKSYTFKIVATDDFGNAVAAPSVRGVSTTIVIASPTPIITTIPGTTPFPSTTAFPAVSPTPVVGFTTPTPSISSVPVLIVTPSPSPRPSPSQVPSTLDDNQAPVADAGADQVVNPSALVILDASASFDQDKDSLSYSWRQISGAKVDLISDRTATPSFSAGGENETYIFVVTVRDANGATATENVTVATRALPQDDTSATVRPIPPDQNEVAPPEPVPPIVSTLLHPADMILFGLSLFSTLLLLFERVMHALGRGKTGKDVVAALPTDAQPQGRVLHYKTGDPIVGAQVMIYGQDGKLRATERTNAQGVFPTFFPAGQYTLGVDMQGFAFAPTAARALTPSGGILYTGGTLTIRNANQPISLIIPMKPTATEVSSARIRLLHLWQSIQHLGRVLSWPIFLSGALLNTILIFMAPRPLYLILEVIYIVLVIAKIALEVHIRPAYGQVRDAITHVPLDLAVVRLLEQGTNRLVMTRVTNNQGKFFALPPSGSYTVTISKPGYATFSKQDIEIKSEHDTTLQMMADLMPIAPQPGGLAQARAALV